MAVDAFSGSDTKEDDIYQRDFAAAITSEEDSNYSDAYESDYDYDTEILVFMSDGTDGKNSWFYCILVFVFNFIILGFGYTTAIFLAPISEEMQDGDIGGTSFVFGVSSGMVFLTSFISGYLTDRFDIKWVVFIGSCISCIGMGLSAFCQSLWQLFICYGLLIGFGFSFCYLPTLSNIGQWFIKYRGLATGIAVSGSGFGTLILPIIANYLQDKFGWRITLLMMAEFFAIVMCICSLPLRRRTSTIKGSWTSLIPYMKTRAFIVLNFSSLFNSFTYFIPYAHIVNYAIVEGVEEDFAPIIVSVMGFSGILGRLTIGYISDKVSRKHIYNFSLSMMAVGCWCWYFSHTIYSIMAIGFFYGFFAGSIVAIKSPLIADYFGVEILASLQGLNLVITGIGTIAGTAIGGYLFDRTGSYTTTIVVASVSITFATFCSLFLPSTHHNSAKKVPG